MRFSALLTLIRRNPRPWKLSFGAFAWLLLISILHAQLNGESASRRILQIGYMPVITNLAAPLLDEATKQGDGIRFKALKFSSFAEMAEALRNGKIDAGFMIAPLSIVLRQQGEDVKVVYIGNRHESTLVARHGLGVTSFSDLSGKTLAVPMRYSGHNISALQLIDKYGLNGQVKVVEMNPPDMASALASGALDAYYVGEPFAAQTLMRGESDQVLHVEEVWPYFMCNLMVVKQSLIDSDPDAVRTLVHSAIRSGYWAKTHLDEAIEVASKYWNQPQDVVRYAFTHPPERIRFDRYLPLQSEFQEMADLMRHYHLTENNDISGLIDDEFALTVKLGNINSIEEVISNN